MPRLTKVWVWPAEGKPGKPWDDEPENDSFLRTSRRVSEAFRRELERFDVRARDSEIEITLGVVGETDLVVQAVERGVEAGPESAEITVPRDFHRLDPYTRAFFVADSFQAITTRLGDVHGWDVSVIDAAMDAVRLDDYGFTWQSDWKTNPDGTRSVRLCARLFDDGFGRVRLEFASGASTGSATETGSPTELTETTITTSEVVAGTGRGDFKRIAKSLDWSGASTVTAKGLGRGFAASAETGEIRTLSVPKRPRANDAHVDNSIPLPVVRVDDPPPLAFSMGGGPINKVPKKYINEVDAIFAHLCFDPEWVEWWLQLGVAEVELEYDFDAKAVKSKVKLTADRITCTIVRPAKTVAKGLLGKAMAQADVAVLLDSVREKTGKQSQPPLPMAVE
jgi:hypothetical protein